MVALRGGVFTMGSPESEEGRQNNEGPQRSVKVSAFAIGKYEVTFGQWDACVSAGGCSNSPDDGGWGRGTRPVIHISLEDAQEYVRWLSGRTRQSYRLPKEAEWEYAARAGTSTRFSFGDEYSNLDDHAWYAGNSNRKTHPTGGKAGNPWRLYDMHGNVWEWAQDCWHGDYNRAPLDGSAWMAAANGDCSRAVIRGGAAFNGNYIQRSAIRDSYPRDKGGNALGFRVVRTLSE
ncbi:MAG: formylglycine-generating enzyme family protein [Rhodobacteraceae bacterium]|nr:formylglycine-generating enzyme family protein [Paracoccaceae bacterium]